MEKPETAFLLSSTSMRLRLVQHGPEKPQIMLLLCSHRFMAFFARLYTLYLEMFNSNAKWYKGFFVRLDVRRLQVQGARPSHPNTAPSATSTVLFGSVLYGIGS